MKKLLLLLTVLALSNYRCQNSSQNQSTNMNRDIDIQGHRGARGLMPENSIPGFIKAVDLGVTTLEMDAAITLDNQVVLSHEPYFSPSICMDSTGLPIMENENFDNNIYHMTYDQVRLFDCGSRFVENFPEQEKIAVYKPLLEEVIDTVESYIERKGLNPVDYNIEIKSSSKGDAVYHPTPDVFATLLLEVVNEKGIQEKTVIQSFDPRALRAVHELEPDIRTALLIGSSTDYKANLQNLGFIPTIYSPNWRLVNEEMVAYMHDNGLIVIPWTVNENDDMQHLLDLNVDGIITDYPDRLIELMKENELFEE